jgi:hypothetical protein
VTIVVLLGKTNNKHGHYESYLDLQRCCKGKGKGVPVHARKAYGMSRYIVLILDTRWEYAGQINLPRPLYSREKNPVPIDYEAGWAVGSVCAFQIRE